MNGYEKWYIAFERKPKHKSRKGAVLVVLTVGRESNRHYARVPGVARIWAVWRKCAKLNLGLEITRFQGLGAMHSFAMFFVSQTDLALFCGKNLPNP